MNPKIEMIIPAREKDLGGFFVRRILPYAKHRMVGPFIFFDHMGPAHFESGHGMDVRPHPHIGLATVTYLFKGKIRHRDSLGSDRIIEPGAINWMTAGHGIVHSERTPAEVRASGGPVHGIQCWVALPNEHEETTPSFTHYPSNTIPELKIGDVDIRVLIGSAFGKKSPVVTHSDLFYADLQMPAGSKLTFDSERREAAAYVVEGSVKTDDSTVDEFSMALAAHGEPLSLEALKPSRVMLLGGAPVGDRLIYWNFVASSEEKLEAAKKIWRPGPGSSRFPNVPGDDTEFIPLPVETANPKGTIL